MDTTLAQQAFSSAHAVEKLCFLGAPTQLAQDFRERLQQNAKALEREVGQ